MNDIPRSYIDEIGQYPLLTKQEEEELSHIILHSTNDEEVYKAKNKMVLSNLRLAAKFAANAYRLYHYQYSIKMSIMDYVQEANIAIMRAAMQYDAKKHKTRFSTYASKSIQNAIIKSIKHSRFVRIPEHQFKTLIEMEQLYIQYGDSLSDAMIMSKLKITKGYLNRLKNSLNTSIIPDYNDFGISNISCGSRSPTSVVQSKNTREYLLEKIKQLSPMEQETIFFVFFGQNTIADLANKHMVSSQRISQLYWSGLRKLKQKIEMDKKLKQREKII